MLERPRMRSALLGMSLVFVLVSGLSAGTTGKIAGVVRDSTTAQPLPGVNIIVEGTQMGAATNEYGEYFIINIPP
ncbi:unnamed protein product, partial [marine sediment metagenome]